MTPQIAIALIVAIVVVTALAIMCLVLDGANVRAEVRRRRAEAELDRQQAELRATILRLATELGAEAHEARKALIRASFLASRSETRPPR